MFFSLFCIKSHFDSTNFCVDQDVYRNKSILLQAYIQHLKSLLLNLSQRLFLPLSIHS